MNLTTEKRDGLTAAGRDGLIVAPDRRAAEAGAAALRAGGTAVEALVAAAAVTAVVQADEAGLGGDGLWLIHPPGAEAPLVIDSIGAAARTATPEALAAAGLSDIPDHGPWAALTVPGAVAGWAAALAAVPGKLSLADLLAPAAEAAAGACPALAATLRRLMTAGLDDFYRGDVARALAADLAAAGAPVTAADLAAHAAETRAPLTLRLRAGTAWAPPPPSQGVAVLGMLGLLDRLEQGRRAGGFDHLHAVIEATKQMALLCGPVAASPHATTLDAAPLLTPRLLAERASDIVPNLALQWPLPPLDGAGGTVPPPTPDGTVAVAPWDGAVAVALAAVDAAGCLALTLQSLGRRGGSGIASAATGVMMPARPGGFTLADGCPRRLAPGKRPASSLAPLLLRLKGGRTLALATGGAAQAQTLAQLHGRLVTFGETPAAALAAPRLRLGPIHPGDADDVKIEAGVSDRVLDGLRAAGHGLRQTTAVDGAMSGPAVALEIAADGVTAVAAADPRATNGAALSVR